MTWKGISAHRMGYVLAGAGTAGAALLRYVLDPYLNNTAHYVLFYFPIILAAYVGGRGPGWFALLLGALTGTAMFLLPPGRPGIGAPEHLLLLVFFLTSGALMVFLATRAHSAQQSALAQAARVRQMLESMSDAYLLLGSDWRMLDMNSEAERVLERPRHELLGQDFWTAFPQEGGLPFGTEARRAMESRVPVRLEEFNPPLGKWLEKSAYPCAEGLAVFFRDVTQRKHDEENLRRDETALRLLFDASTRLLVAEHPEQALREIFDAFADHLRVDVYFNYLVTPDGRRLRLNAWKGLDEATARAAEFLEFGQSLCGTAALERRRVILDSIEAYDDPNTALVRGLGVRAYACHPFLNGGVHGTVAFGARDRDHFTDEELGLMRAVADQVSLALGRQQLTAELERRAAALGEANKAKDHFLAILSHELRTPLTPVLAGVSLLQVDAHLDPETRHSLDVVRRNVELEARLIDDLLDITRIARGKIELDKRPVVFCEVLLEAVEVCQPDIEARRIHLNLDVERGANCWVKADPARLQQVFWNLLKNAIKFTPPGGCIQVGCFPADSWLAAEVSDNGEGIEPEALGRIFNAFEQAEPSIARQFGGLGLGLAISKALVDMHGGTIEAHSAGRGQGATFRVRLPITQPATEPGPAPVRTAPAAKPRERPLQVLLVEDHGDTARILSQLLARQGYQVETAGDVATALEASSRHHFDLLISDLGLPDRSGLDLMRELRARGETLPAIALSGFGQEDDVTRTRDAGFTTHLTKPVNFEQFYRIIAAVAG